MFIFFHFQEIFDHELFTPNSHETSQEISDPEKLFVGGVFLGVTLSICEQPNKKMERKRRENIFINNVKYN